MERKKKNNKHVKIAKESFVKAVFFFSQKFCRAVLLGMY